jgi:FkbM family methyltransferase
MASAIVRLLLGRSLKFSFAYTGEDRILEGIFKPLITANGFYVDVGCNHPKFLSNTYGLYRKGWRGICIDANPEMIQKFKFFRPRDVAISALVSDEVGEKEFYTIENNVLSTVEIANLRDAEKQGFTYQTETLQPRTLTDILDTNNCPREIGILSIDVEEHDYSVLKSLDFQKYSPKLIVVEDETYQVDAPEVNLIYALLKGQGYDLVGFVLTNLYFLRKE